MNEILFNILSVVVTTIILPLISMIGGKLINWLSTKIKNEKAGNLIGTTTEIVINAVKSVFQTYVDSLKKEGEFGKESQLVALNKAKEVAISQMTEEVKEFIRENYGDLDAWLNTQIEATIDTLKKQIIAKLPLDSNFPEAFLMKY